MGFFSWLFGKSTNQTTPENASSPADNSSAPSTTSSSQAATTNPTTNQPQKPAPSKSSAKQFLVATPCSGTVLLPENFSLLAPALPEHAVGLNPGQGAFVAPVTGVVTSLTSQGVSFSAKEGKVSVELGFLAGALPEGTVEFLVTQGQEVTQGTPLLTLDLAQLLKQGKTTMAYLLADKLVVTAQLRQQYAAGDVVAYVDLAK